MLITGCGDSVEDFVFTSPNRPIINPTPDPTPDPIDVAPQVTLDTGALLYVRDSDAATLSPSAIVVDDNANLSGGTLTLSATGTGLNINVPAAPAIGTITNNNSSSVSIALNGDATPAAIQSLLRTVTVSTTGGTAAFGDRTVTVTDANGLSDSATRTVSILVGVTANFDDFNLGDVDGQQGWTSPGMMEQAVVAVNRMEAAFVDFGTRALRISNADDENTFNQALQSPPLSVPVGESTAPPLATERNNTFSASFEFATTSATEQVGLQMSISPSDFDEGRMSVIRLLDTPGGIDVVVFEYDATTDTFPSVDVVQDLSRAVPHTMRIVLRAVDGADNDVLQIFVDGNLEYTGTGWEEFFRTDPAAVGVLESPRLIDRLLFQVRPGNEVPANNGGGFLFNNFSITSTDTTP